MVSKKIVVGISAIILVVVLVAVFAFTFHQITPKEQSYWNGESEYREPQVTYKAVLDVNGYERSGYWTRNVVTDLPEYTSTIICQVSNTGNSDARNVNVEIMIDGNLLATEHISSLSVWDVKTYSYSISMPYDSSRSIYIRAACSESSDTFSFMVESRFPRRGNPELAKLFITPREATVVQLENEILNDKSFITPNWIALRDWVGKNIQYAYDSEIYGTDEYWQFAKETLSRRTGDCEDYAILLVSLLRVSGYSENDVYVVLGRNEKGEHHAWVKINLGIVGWYNLEPQKDGWNTLIGDYFDLSGYQAMYQFNDKQFQQIK